MVDKSATVHLYPFFTFSCNPFQLRSLPQHQQNLHGSWVPAPQLARFLFALQICVFVQCLILHPCSQLVASRKDKIAETEFIKKGAVDAKRGLAQRPEAAKYLPTRASSRRCEARHVVPGATIMV